MRKIRKKELKLRRQKRIRAKIFGSAKVPRLCVFRSIKHIYAQLIDDEKGKTLAFASDIEVKKSAGRIIKSGKGDKTKRKLPVAFEVGKLIAKKASEKKIEKAIFDRAGYKYHGIIKQLAEGAREGGLKF